MFKRRTPRTILKKLREVLWPSMGWRRALTYVRHRTLRLSDTSRKIAVGLAIGAAISFTPIVGTHFIQAAVMAYIVRANVTSALIGTLVGNPWTFPFMWWASISFGSLLLGLFGFPASTVLPDVIDFSIFWGIATHEPMRIFLPWLVGGYLMACLTWTPFYLIFYGLLKAAKTARKKAKLKAIKRVTKDMTKQKK